MTDLFDARAFRDALSSFATGVTVITARDAQGEAVGMTASSFNSVSVEPPLVLWSVAKSALSAPAFKDAKHWIVHVLTTEQIDLSTRFSRSGTDKFDGLACVDNRHGVPILSGCAARFECCAWQVHDGGDHWILIGEVQSLDRQPGNPLVFCSGSYATSEPMQTRADKSHEISNNDGPDPIEDLLMYQLSRATRQMSELFHKQVSDSGLTIPEWRLLASLHGPTSRGFDDLSERTFIDPVTLNDMVQTMVEKGLCVDQHNPADRVILGTQAGHDRVSHLFEVGADIENEALGQDGSAEQLKTLLRQVVRNTLT